MIKKSVILLSFLTLALPLAAWGVSGLGDRPVVAEAEKVFAYDRNHPHALPAHLIRSLSLAIAFYDDEGARKLIRILGKEPPR